MSIFIKAGLWLEKKTGYKGEFNLTRYVTDLITATPPALPYKMYTALLTQEGGSAPQAIVLENTIGELSWDYREPGYYGLSSLGTPFVENKTFINNNIVGPAGADFVFNRMTNRDDTGFDVQKGYAFEYVGTNGIRLKTYSDAGVLANDVIGTNNKLCIEIRVYN